MNPFLHHIFFYSSQGRQAIDPDAKSLFDRGDFTNAEKDIINETITKLKDDEQWGHIFECKVYGVSTESNSLLDWKNANYNPEKVGSPVFEAYNGWIGTGNTTDYIRTHFNPNGVVEQNNLLIIAWELSTQTTNGVLFGCQDAANEGILLIP